MSHDYHEGEPNYNRWQLFHDGCRECKMRSEDLIRAIEHIKDMNYAWARALRFEKGWMFPEELPVSEAEAPVLRLIWALLVRFERDGIPLGLYPPTATSMLRTVYRSQACPYCGTSIWGDTNNIDSGLRKHIEYCPLAPDDQDDTDDNSHQQP